MSVNKSHGEGGSVTTRVEKAKTESQWRPRGRASARGEWGDGQRVLYPVKGFVHVLRVLLTLGGQSWSGNTPLMRCRFGSHHKDSMQS